MINWTVGAKSLRHVMVSSGVKCVLTSQKFMEKLGLGVDLGPLREEPGVLIFMEDIKEQFFIVDVIKAKLFSSTKSILHRYAVDTIKTEDECVVLYTSGSESMPKGVPLTHRNVMANCDAVVAAAGLTDADVILGILPPFHSFGFTITTVLPMVTGTKAAYYPNPTEYRVIARQISKWGATIFLGTPTFLSGVLLNSQNSHTKTLRLCVTGAEKADEALFKNVAARGIKDGLCEGYGITECGPVLTVNKPGQPPAGVGYPVKGVQLKIADVVDGPSGKKVVEKPQVH